MTDLILMLDNRLPKAGFCGQLKCGEKHNEVVNGQV